MRPPRPIEILAVDLDGTLAVRGHEVTDVTRQALSALTAAGIHLVIATGRRYRTTRAVVDALDMPLAAVCLGGSLVKDHDHATLHTTALGARLQRAVVELIRDAGETAIIQHDADIRGERDVIVDDARPYNARTLDYLSASAPYSHPGDAAAVRDALAVSVWGDGADLARLQHRITAACGTQVTTSLVPDASGGPAWYLEVIRGETDKWRGLLHYAAVRGLSSEAICCVGDAANDLPMIRNSAWGVAMGNATDDVKAAARWVTRRHDEDGIAHLVERILAAH